MHRLRRRRPSESAERQQPPSTAADTSVASSSTSKRSASDKGRHATPERVESSKKLTAAPSTADRPGLGDLEIPSGDFRGSVIIGSLSKRFSVFRGQDAATLHASTSSSVGSLGRSPSAPIHLSRNPAASSSDRVNGLRPLRDLRHMLAAQRARGGEAFVTEEEEALVLREVQAEAAQQPNAAFSFGGAAPIGSGGAGASGSGSASGGAGGGFAGNFRKSPSDWSLGQPLRHQDENVAHSGATFGRRADTPVRVSPRKQHVKQQQQQAGSHFEASSSPSIVPSSASTPSPVSSSSMPLKFSRNRPDHGFGIGASERLRDAEVMRKAAGKKSQSERNLAAMAASDEAGAGEEIVLSPIDTGFNTAAYGSMQATGSAEGGWRPPASSSLSSITRQNLESNSQASTPTSSTATTPLNLTGGKPGHRQSLLQALSPAAQKRVSRALALIEEDIARDEAQGKLQQRDTASAPAVTPGKHRRNNSSISRSPAYYDNLATVLTPNELESTPPVPKLPDLRSPAADQEIEYVTPTKGHRKAYSSASPVSLESVQGGYRPGQPRPYTPTRTGSIASIGDDAQALTHARSFSQPSISSFREHQRKPSTLTIDSRAMQTGSASAASFASTVSPVAEAFESISDAYGHQRNESVDTGSVYPSSGGAMSPPASARMPPSPYDTTFDPADYYLADDTGVTDDDALERLSLGSSYQEDMDAMTLDDMFKHIDSLPDTGKSADDSPLDLGLEEIAAVQDRLVQVAKDVRKALLEDSRPSGVARLQTRPSVRARKPEMTLYDGGVSELVQVLSTAPDVPQARDVLPPTPAVPSLQRQPTASSTASSSLARTPSSSNGHGTKRDVVRERTSPGEAPPQKARGFVSEKPFDALFGSQHSHGHSRTGSSASARLADDPEVRRDFEARVAQATASLQRNASQSLGRKKSKKGRNMVIGSPTLIESSNGSQAPPVISSPPPRTTSARRSGPDGALSASPIAPITPKSPVATPDSGVKGFMAKLARKPSQIVRKASKRDATKKAALPISPPLGSVAPSKTVSTPSSSPLIPQLLEPPSDPSRKRIVRRTLVLSAISEQPSMNATPQSDTQHVVSRRPSTRRKPVNRTSADQRLEQAYNTPPTDRTETSERMQDTLHPRPRAGTLTQASMQDVPQLLSSFEPKALRNSRVIEIREMSNGQMEYALVDGDDVDRMEDLGDSPSASVENTPHLRDARIQALQPRPETKVYYSSSAHVAELLEELSSSCIDGKFRILPSATAAEELVEEARESPQGQQLSSPSGGASANVRRIEDRLQALMAKVNASALEVR